MTKHTPGPWRAETIEVTGGDDYTIESETHEIATLYDCLNPNTIKDARLIAAAPELLEALESVRVTLQAVVSDNKQNIAAKQRLEEVNKAINKAKGGQ